MASSYAQRGSCVCGYAYSAYLAWLLPRFSWGDHFSPILRNILYFICDMSKRNAGSYLCGATLSSAYQPQETESFKKKLQHEAENSSPSLLS